MARLSGLARLLSLAALLVACGADTVQQAGSPEPSIAGSPHNELFSEPAEYRAQPPSAELGRAYFTQYGVGDPYGAGVPYPIYRALMAEMPDILGESWAAISKRFGFVPNRDKPDGLPLGFHLTRDPNTGVDFVVNNCQVCHAGRVRTAVGEQVVEGLGNRQVRIHAYGYAFARFAADERFNDKRLAKAAVREAKRLKLTWPRQYRGALIVETTQAVRERFGPRQAQLARLAKGLPGRVATIEGFSLALSWSRNDELPLPKVTGWTRVPDIAVARYRETNSFDGIATGSPSALAVGADFAFGVRPRWLEEHRHIATSMFLYMRTFQRQLPFPEAINRELATAGYVVFERRCSRCHGHYARPGESSRVSYREKVVPAKVIGTDTARLDAVSDAFLQASNAVPESRGLTVSRHSGGWVPRPLVQVWARGQYGHNGQWPDLAALATPPEQRPTRFVVAPSAPLNLERVGQAWRSVDTGAPGEGEYLYDGTRPGFGVQGHTFLSDAPPDERSAALEYLKTL